MTATFPRPSLRLTRRRALAGLLAVPALTGCGGVARHASKLYADARAFVWGGPEDEMHPAMLARQDQIEDIVKTAQAEYTADVAKRWGDQAAIPSRTVWVHYDPAMTTRAVMDFEAGEMRAETLLEPGEDPAAAAARLSATLEGTRAASAADLKALDGTRVRAEALAAERGVRLPNAGHAFSDEALFTEVLPPVPPVRPVREGRVVGADGRAREKLVLRVPFTRGRWGALAARFAGPIQREAARHEAPTSLVLAIIQNESAFNPRATSHIPAYGLMQIVPRSAGLDAYDFVHGMMRLLGPEYLYDPENNLELGTAYLWILDGRYLAAIEDPQSREYCVIAAYNTGSGNVARAFTGTTSVRRAAPIINALRPEQVYARLERDLPYEETRRYLRKVTEARANYLDWDARASPSADGAVGRA